jgi:glycosyltransferase involved in cell wall biosynthesis
MSRVSISVIIMARNEEANIVEAIKSVPFASQIVVADTGSSDNTIILARNAGAETHSIEFDGYGPSKNLALAFASCDWVLSIDADERVSPELAESIIKIVDDPNSLNGYSICRLTYFLGKPIRHSGWFPEYVLRFFKRGKGAFSSRLVHEGVKVDGSQGKLSGLLYHYSYKTLESYIDKLNIYSTLNAQELHKSGKRSNLLDIIFHPPATFIKMYLIKFGFFDGFNGLVLALLSSFHTLIKYIKLRELHKQGSGK